MEGATWLKQSDKPVFDDILWSQPQNRQQAGKLLIAGGSSHGFAAPAQAYGAAMVAGAGSIRVLLPDAVKKQVGKLINEAGYAPSTPSGSFARSALSELLTVAEWADAVLLAGDFGRNSETAIMLDSFVEKNRVKFVICQDSLDYFLSQPEALLSQQDCLIVASFTQLQKLVTASKNGLVIKYNTDLLMLVDGLQKFSTALPATIITSSQEQIIVASSGRVSTTKLSELKAGHEIKLAATAGVIWLQNPSKPFESATTAAWSILEKNLELIS